jgi:hypothetical protein
MAADESGRGSIWPQRPGAAEAFGILQRGFDVGDSDVGNWGIRVPLPPTATTLSATSMLLFLRSSVRVDPEATPMVCRVELDDRVFAVRVENGQLQFRLATQPCQMSLPHRPVDPQRSPRRSEQARPCGI